MLKTGPSGRSQAVLELSPEFLAQYRLDRSIGAGAMGIVYSAEQRSTGRRVAIKFLAGSRDADAVARFEREGKLLARVSHPAVVRVLDAGAVGEHPYLVTELLTGETLRDRLDSRTRLPPPEVAALAAELLAALAACHDAGIVHRDVKPANVMYDERGAVRLVDLGIGKWLEEAGMTRQGAVLGTPRYMAPEIATGESELGPWTDLYSLGCVLFECAAGTPPYPGQSPVEVMGRHVHSPVPRLADALPEVPAALSAVIEHAMAKDPKERPASAAAMLAELEGATRKRVTGRARGKATGPARPVAARRRISALPAGLALAAGMLLAIATARALRPAREPEAVPTPEAPSASPGTVERRLITSPYALHHGVSEIAASPDGRWVATSVRGLSVRLWDTRDERLVASWTAPEPLHGMEVDPAGRRVVGQLRRWRDAECVVLPVGGPPERVHAGPETASLRLAPGGAVGLLVDGAQARVVPLGTATGGHALITLSARPLAAACTSDGSRVVAVHDGRLEVVDGRTGKSLVSAALGALVSSAEVRLQVAGGDGSAVVSSAGGLEVYRLSDGARLRQLVFPLPVAPRVSPDGSMVALAAPPALMLVEVASGQMRRAVPGLTCAVLAGAPPRAVIGTATGFRIDAAPDHAVRAVHVDPYARLALLDRGGRTMRWDRRAADEREVAGAGGGLTAVAASPDGLRLIAARGSALSTATLVDVDCAAGTARVLPGERRVAAPAADGALFLAAADGHLSFRPASGAERALGALTVPDGALAILTGPSAPQVDPSGATALVRLQRGEIFACDLTTGRIREVDTGRLLLLDNQPHDAPARFLSAGRTLVCETGPGELSLIDVATLKHGRKLRGPALPLTALASSRDERVLAGGYADGTIQLWDLRAWRPLSRHSAGETAVLQLGVDPDDRTLLSIDEDGVLASWSGI